jgi:hypothetical protein
MRHLQVTTSISQHGRQQIRRRMQRYTGTSGFSYRKVQRAGCFLRLARLGRCYQGWSKRLRLSSRVAHRSTTPLLHLSHRSHCQPCPWEKRTYRKQPRPTTKHIPLQAASLTAKFSVQAASCGLLACVAATSVGPSGCGLPAVWPTGTKYLCCTCHRLHCQLRPFNLSKAYR